ncbi:ATP-dependent Clp protease proteolytic subunit 6, chloroplastic [Linum grandiflorum]
MLICSACCFETASSLLAKKLIRRWLRKSYRSFLRLQLSTRRQILWCAHVSSIYLNTPGGNTHSVMAIYDCMSTIKPKVGTVGFGMVASQAVILLAGGEKGMRYSMPNSRVMLQQPHTGCGGPVKDVRRQVDEAVHTRQKIDKMFAAFTGQTLETVQQLTQNDHFMYPAEALDFGLIDEILVTEE